MKASQQAIERGVKDCVFIDYKRRSGHFDVTTVASIKEITEKVNLSLWGLYSIPVLSKWHLWTRTLIAVVRLLSFVTTKFLHHCL